MTIHRPQRRAAGNRAPRVLPKSDLESRQALRRVAYVRATANALVQLGANASMTDIAKAAGVPKPTIYRVFASRAELIQAVFQHVHGVITQCVDEQADGFESLPKRVHAMAIKERAVFRAALVILRGHPAWSTWIERLLDLMRPLALPLLVPGRGAPKGASKRAVAASWLLTRLLLSTIVARLERYDGMTEEVRSRWWKRLVLGWQRSTRAAFQLDSAGSDLDGKLPVFEIMES